MRFVVNPDVRPEALAAPSTEAGAFHARLPGCAPTPVRALDGVAEELGLGPRTRVLLIATEGITDPDSYARVVTA